MPITAKLISKVIEEFAADFVQNPYKAYTEHGLHAVFYSDFVKAMNANEENLLLKYKIDQNELNVYAIQKEAFLNIP